MSSCIGKWKGKGREKGERGKGLRTEIWRIQQGVFCVTASDASMISVSTADSHSTLPY